MLARHARIGLKGEFSPMVTHMLSRLLAGATFIAVPGAALATDLTGIVSDGSDTRVLTGAEVSLVELGRTAVADTDGRYRFTDIPAGTYTLRARFAGASRVEQGVTVPASGELVRNIAIGEAGDTILVVGQQATLASALSRQRAADGVQSVLTRDAIGQFPDQNVAEAVRRAPGVNVLNDQGEGRFIAVRGLDPNLNASSINGVRVPAPESDIRSVALDVVAVELVESIEIKKTLTPDMDADTIGASIEINTTSAFDRKKDLFAISAEGTYNELADRLSPKGSIDFSTRITDTFGIAGGLSYYRRFFATDNIEADDWAETDDGVAYAGTLEYRDYDVRRTRSGASLSLDWRPSTATKLFARGVYNRFSDQEFRRRLIFEMDGEPTSGTATGASFVSDDGQIRVERDNKDRFEAQTIQSYQVGGETVTGPWTLNFLGAYSRASERENGSLDPIAFRRDFEEPGELGVTFDYTRYKRPLYAINAGNEAFLDPSEYEFESVERTTLSDAKDREWSFRADVKRSFALSRGTFDVQFGGKARLRRKTFNLQLDVFDGFDGDFTLADVTGPQTYGLADIEPAVGKRATRSFFRSNLAGFELNPLDTAFESAVQDFRVDEDIYAGYLLGRYEAGPLRIVGGVRMEHTRNDIAGNLVELVEEGGIRDGVELDEDTLFVSPLRTRRDYTDWLPSVALRWEATPKLLVRGGVFKSIVRPNIGQLAPRFLVEENDEGDREGEFGNPNLRPYRAWNLDVGVEWYFARSSVLQAGFFYKDIEDFIVAREFDDITFNGVFADEAVIPINGDKAKVRGFELAYAQVFRSLPAPFDGLLVNANYTFTDAEGNLGDRRFALPASSRHTFNVALGYEKGPVSLRAAGTYRSKYLDELGEDALDDRLIRPLFQVDLSARVRVTRALQVFAEMVNLNDAEFIAYQRGPGSRRLLQFERYNWTAKMGVRATF